MPEPADAAEQTPDEIMRAAHRRIEAALAEDLLDRVRAAPPDFFERLIVNLLGPGAIRDFFGSLDRHKAAKGLFVRDRPLARARLAPVERLLAHHEKPPNRQCLDE